MATPITFQNKKLLIGALVIVVAFAWYFRPRSKENSVRDYRFPDVYTEIIANNSDMSFAEVQEVCRDYFESIAGSDDGLNESEFVQLGRESYALVKLPPHVPEEAKLRVDKLYDEQNSKLYRSSDKDQDGTLSAPEYCEMFMGFVRRDDQNKDEQLSVNEVKEKFELVLRFVQKTAEATKDIKRLDAAGAATPLAEMEEIADKMLHKEAAPQ